jgi:hypothetical protein
MVTHATSSKPLTRNTGRRPGRFNTTRPQGHSAEVEAVCDVNEVLSRALRDSFVIDGADPRAIDGSRSRQFDRVVADRVF